MTAGSAIVVKIGGSTMGAQDTALEDIVSLHREGRPVVVVHGGGPLISSWLERQGVESHFSSGLRITDEATLEVVVAVLAGLVNKELVAGLERLGGRAWGLSGVDGALLQARLADPALGWVGEVERVNLEPLRLALAEGYIAVVAPIGFYANGEGGARILNLNADTAAGELAAALGAEVALFLTDVPGVQDQEGRVVPSLSPTHAREWMERGILSGGMVPKVRACLRALAGAERAVIADGRAPRVLAAALRGEIGTAFKKEE